jgi:predicted GNAT family N-acyltransferase
MAPAIEPLARKHDRENFDCGVSALNDYLRRQAAQDVRRSIGRVYVAHEISSIKVLGYYTLSAASFSKKNLPEKEEKRLPHYPVPAALLGRLAVDRKYQGKKVGKYLLFDAFHRVLQATETLAAYAIIVDAKGNKARSFYEHYGFLRFPDTPYRLFIPLETLRLAFE